MSNTLNLFKALGDQSRLRIINLLVHNNLCVHDIQYLLKMSQPRVSRHLKILTASQVLTKVRQGKWAFFGINRKTLNAAMMKILEKSFSDIIYLRDLENLDKLLKSN